MQNSIQFQPRSVKLPTVWGSKENERCLLPQLENSIRLGVLTQFSYRLFPMRIFEPFVLWADDLVAATGTDLTGYYANVPRQATRNHCIGVNAGPIYFL